MNITYRPLEESDLEPLLYIMMDVWNYGRFLERASELVSRIILFDYVANATFTQVAVVDGVVAGVILGTTIGQETSGPLKEKILALREKAIKDYKREIVLMKYSVKALSDKYLKKCYETVEECNKHYDSEISLFILKKDYHGFGIGKALYNAYIDDLRKNNLKSYYIISDDFSNYQSLEHLGMKRAKEKVSGIPLISEYTIYIYDNELE